MITTLTAETRPDTLVRIKTMGITVYMEMANNIIRIMRTKTDMPIITETSQTQEIIIHH